MKTPEIDAEFRDLVPSLTADERGMLETSLITEGCRDPILVWQGLVVDGHNRLDICQARDLAYQTTPLEFQDRNAAKTWILRNQLGRRNLDDYDRALIALKLKPLIESKARDNQRTALVQNSAQALPRTKQSPVKTRDEVAKIAGVSHDTIRKVEAIEKEASPDLKQKVREGKTSINAAFKEVRPPKPKPESTPELTPEPAQTTRTNGVLGNDPPDVAAARAAGKIGAGVIVEVTEPEPVESAEPIEADPVTPEEADLSDDDWLDALPLSAVLAKGLTKTFRADALVYRKLATPRKSFAHHAARAIPKQRRGEYAYRIMRFLKTDHPKHWLLCPTTENGGCCGTGQVQLVGACPKCRGKGYWIK